MTGGIKIISGRFRGRSISAPPNNRPDIRPTKSRVREAVFSKLHSRLKSWNQLHVADLFAGTGAMGLEALSRGACEARFVDIDHRACRLIRDNAAKLGVLDLITVGTQDVRRIGSVDRCYDLLFLDPPYSYRGQDWEYLLTGLLRKGWVGTRSLLVLESSARIIPQLPERLNCINHATYGQSAIHLIGAKEAGK